ncbi:MAG: hypothetical protein ABSC25_10985 [Roseiarcus sp.]|jgi:hypothetical protein
MTPSSPSTETQPLFRLGQIRITPGIQNTIDFPRVAQLLSAHTKGESWPLDRERRAANRDSALSGSGDVWSTFPIDPSTPSKGFGPNTIWVITYLDIEVTVIMLPHEH